MEGSSNITTRQEEANLDTHEVLPSVGDNVKRSPLSVGSLVYIAAKIGYCISALGFLPAVVNAKYDQHEKNICSFSGKVLQFLFRSNPDFHIAAVTLDFGALEALWGKAPGFCLKQYLEETPLLRAIKRADAKISLHLAAKGGHLGTVRMLLNSGEKVNMRDQDQWTALHYAAREGHHEVVAALLNAGAEVDARDQCQWTALHYAVDRGYLYVVRALLAAGAAVDIKIQSQWTALHLAAEGGHTAIVRVLLVRGANLAAKTSFGSTPLILASDSGHLSVVQLLLRCGAPVNDRDNDGNTSLRCAISWNHKAVANYLRLKGGTE